MNGLDLKCLRSLVECQEWIKLQMKRCIDELNRKVVGE